METLVGKLMVDIVLSALISGSLSSPLYSFLIQF